ncbi:hypothetical protein [Cytobacillus oceanisediminis]|uniref:hypothetical protein n=1 Tax=Cytobacillus oceanisediminis TaxID=665099 RepID=UPI003734E235
MAPNLVTNVRLSFIKTRQALQFTHSALNIFQQLHIFGLPPNPIKIVRYQDAIADLTNATIAFQALPLDVQLPPNPILPPHPIFPPNLSNQVIIKLAQDRTLLAMNRTEASIQFIDAALALSQSDTLTGLLAAIKDFQEEALVALNDAFNLPPVATDS